MLHKINQLNFSENIVLQDKYIQSFKPWWNRSREEEYEIGVKKSVYVTKLMQDLNITDFLDQMVVKEYVCLSVHPFVQPPQIGSIWRRLLQIGSNKWYFKKDGIISLPKQTKFLTGPN